MSRIHIGEFYLQDGDSTLALENFQKANEIAVRTSNHRDILSTLKFLSQVDQPKSHVYLQEYITLNDSLQNEERAIRNKFARIQFETDEFIAQNEQLSEQKKWLVGSSAITLLLSFLTVGLFRQNARNRRLQYERDQRKANEDIYHLLLDQKSRISHGRNQEKKRISQELHDGVLSRMFGIRLILNSLNQKHDEQSIKAKQEYLDELRLVEEEIRSISHDLQESDLLEDVGFLKIVQHLLEEQKEVLGFSPVLSCEADTPWKSINNKTKMNLYRIIQEALQNSRKYAAASKLSINFRIEHKWLVLSILDNGKGFDTSKKVRGIGLKNMKSRAKDINGTFDVFSDTTGTEITIKIPLSHG